MTTLRVNMPAGQISKDRVTTAGGSAIGTDIVRILIDDANCASKSELLKAIDTLRQKIVETQWPL